MSGDTRLHAGHMTEESEPPSPDPRLDVFKSCAVFHLLIRYMVKPADSEDASQATHVKSLHAIDISLEESSRFSTVQKHR